MMLGAMPGAVPDGCSEQSTYVRTDATDARSQDTGSSPAVPERASRAKGSSDGGVWDAMLADEAAREWVTTHSSGDLDLCDQCGRLVYGVRLIIDLWLCPSCRARVPS